ncbi:MAG: hypothetical protein GIX03_07950, partial [Candidatus Eremiobacteraeota bacterium]|nr:hypothetical protein [Candidatus Eremiobacteraeota bacterium]MBC5822629.1 hypothetical protein [Candidatus Eremiobacteraeota bacterium]
MLLADAATNSLSPIFLVVVIIAALAIRAYCKRVASSDGVRSIAAREAAADLSRSEFAPGSPAPWTPPKSTLCIVCKKAIPLPGRFSCHACGLDSLERSPVISAREEI